MENNQMSSLIDRQIIGIPLNAQMGERVPPFLDTPVNGG